MPISRSQSLLLAIAALVCVAAIAGGIYLYRSHRAVPASGPLPKIVSELPPGAPAIAYIDVAALRALKDSPLASLLGMATSGPSVDQEYKDFVHDTGFDYARDLDQTALAFWPPQTSPATKSPTRSPTGPEDGDTLAIADGRFDLAKIQAYALRSGAIVIPGKHSLYRVPGDPPVSFEFVSLTRVVLASGPNAQARLLSMEAPGLDPLIRDLVNHVGGAPFFAVARADALPPSVYASLGKSPQIAAMAKSIQGITLAGQPSADNVELALDAECNSMTSALQMSTLLDGFRIFGSLAMSDPKTKSHMTKQQAKLLAALLAQVQIHQQENWVRITWEVTPEMLAATTKH